MNKLWGILVLSLVIPLFAMAENITHDSGFTAKTSKIFGGVKSPSGDWPSTVAILNTSTINLVESGNATYPLGGFIPTSEANYQAQFCGGSLIDARWVLTAAHCVVDNATGIQNEASTLTALVGTSDLLNGGERIPVKRIIVHPNYNSLTIDSDIALLELYSASTVEVIGFATEDIPASTNTTVVGWGVLETTLSPTDLYEVDIPIVDRTVCELAYTSAGTTSITDSMICAGYPQGVKDSCQGDSGGPLMAVFKNQLVQVGITSWGGGINCGEAGKYGIYTRLIKFQGWIDSNITASNTTSGGGSFFYLLPFLFLLSIRSLIKSKGE